ncbi:IS110 family transposase [Methylobacterium sp. GXF4]|uniref:IS110 family transposase n=1 Tax=Methylobacterium sp. GXF4 TaxID=1096546 RepID=UPI00063EEA77|nr:IS110 family transposase [Methylobacterium sp. GXF4]
MLGIDLGKNSCSLVGFDVAGGVVLRRRARRETVVGLTAKPPACIVAMEACCGAHHLGRLLEAQGHTVRLISIPGIGTMTATALRAAVDDGSTFARVRDLPAWLGLVPRQHTTGGKPKLLGISKRDNAYLRGLFIHGARAALPSMAKAEDATGRWLRGLLARAHYNAVVVALAAKLARVAWATLWKGVSFERQPEPAHA